MHFTISISKYTVNRCSIVIFSDVLIILFTNKVHLKKWDVMSLEESLFWDSVKKLVLNPVEFHWNPILAIFAGPPSKLLRASKPEYAHLQNGDNTTSGLSDSLKIALKFQELLDSPLEY